MRKNSARISTTAIVLSLLLPTAWCLADIPDPLAYWSFDGDVVDQTGNGFDGILQGGAFDNDVPPAIGSGSALMLDSMNQEYVDLSAHVADFSFLAQGSIAAWFKTGGTIGVILAASQSLDGSSELRLFYDPGDVIVFDVREEAGGEFVDDNLMSPAGVGNNEWHHVAATVDSVSQANLYIDGEIVATTFEPFFSAVLDLDTMAIGRNVDSSDPAGQWFFGGSIDDLAVWEELLSCDQVAALAAGASPLAGPPQNPPCACIQDEELPLPVGYWNFDDNVEDHSGFNSHGTLAGLGGGPVYDPDIPGVLGRGSSLFFDAINEDHVDLSSHVAKFAGLTEGTISAWIKSLSSSTEVILAASDSSAASNEIRLFCEGTFTLRCGVRANGNIWMSRSIVNTNDGEWHHVAVTVSDAGNFLYLDGLPLSVSYQYGNSTLSQFFDDVPNLNSMSIGRNVDSSNSAGQWFFTGSIDDLAVFDRPLTCGEIAALASGAPVPVPDPEDGTPPARPTGLTAVAEDGVVTLDWEDNTEVDLAGYIVYRSEVSGGPHSALGDPLRISELADESVVNGTTYYYVVSAIDRRGNESAFSSQVSATPQTGVDATPPAPPQNLQAGGVDGRVVLEWEDNTELDLAGYAVYRALSTGGPYSKIAEDRNASRFVDNDVNNGTLYYYVVTALDTSDNESDQSSEAEATPRVVELTVPFAYWPLDEGEGQVANDLSGNDYDGSLGFDPAEDANDPTWIDSVTDANGVTRGPVLDFAGDNSPQWIDLSFWVFEFADLDQGTISAWIKLPGGDGVDVILAASQSIDPSSEIRFYYEQAFGGVPGIRYDIRADGTDAFPIISSFPLDPTDDTWHHVAVTVDSAGMTSIIVDGFVKTTAQEVGFFSAVPDLDVMSIGRNIDNTGSQWHVGGQLSDIAVWDEPLAPAEVLALASGKQIPVGVTDLTPPARPTGLEAMAEDSRVLLDWNDNAEEDLGSYNIYRSEISGGPHALLQDGIDGSAFVDESVVNGTTYHYVVTAVDRSGNESQASGEVSATPLEGLDVTPPHAPGNLLAVGLDNEVVLNWNDNEEDDVAFYNVYRGNAAGGPYEKISTADESLYRDTTVVNDTTYYYVVTAVDTSENESPSSNEAAATPLSGEIPRPFAYWPLDEGEGQDVLDMSGNQYDGFLGDFVDADGGDPVWVESVTDGNGVTRGPVLDFAGDAAPQWVTLTNWVGEFADLEEGTISAWVKLPGGDAVDVILAASDPNDASSEIRFFYEFYRGEHGLRYDIRDNDANPITNLSTEPEHPADDKWHHVAVVVQETGETALYMDGVPGAQGEQEGFFSAVTDLTTMSLGRNIDSSGPQWHFQGQMSDVAVWDTPLTPAAIMALATGTSPLGEPPDLKPRFVRGDSNGDGSRNITDGVFIFSFLFTGGQEPSCNDAADTSDQGSINITSGIYILNFLFLGGPEPPAPFPECAADPTPEATELGCESFPPCEP